MSDKQRTRAKLQELNAVENPEGIQRTTLSYNDEMMMCHFIMKSGAEIPLHHHPAAQNGYVISGKIEFKTGDGSDTFIAEPGSSYVFGPDQPHGAKVIKDAEVLEVFAPMRPEYADN